MTGMVEIYPLQILIASLAGWVNRRQADVLSFYGDNTTVPPLAFSSTIKDMKALLHNA